MEEPYSVTGSYNNRTMFAFDFIVRIANETGFSKTKINAIPCEVAISKLTDEDQRNKIMSNFGNELALFVCPDLD